MNQASAAIAKPVSAIIIVSRHFVLSCCSDQKSILYAPIITKITAIVPAIPIKKSIKLRIAFGISSRCTSQFRSLESRMPRMFVVSPSAKTVNAVALNDISVKNIFRSMVA